MPRTHYSQSQNDEFLIRVAIQFSKKFPSSKVFSSDGTLNNGVLFFNYYHQYKTRKGVLESRREIKRMQDAMSAFFIDYFSNEVKQRILEGIQAMSAISDISEKVCNYLLPYVMNKVKRIWESTYANNISKNIQQQLKRDGDAELANALQKLLEIM